MVENARIVSHQLHNEKLIMNKNAYHNCLSNLLPKTKNKVIRI